MPQGVACILPVLREGVLTGSPEQKEEAARALGAVIKLTSAEALRPSVVSITGPLIRILGDRFAWTVKSALLETLTLLLLKVSTLFFILLHYQIRNFLQIRNCYRWCSHPNENISHCTVFG